MGRSEGLKVLAEEERRRRRRRGLGLGLGLGRRDGDGDGGEGNGMDGVDTSGPWFDGVVLMKGRNLTEVDVKRVKQKREHLSLLYL